MAITIEVARATITGFGPEPYRARRPIQVEIGRVGESFVAAFQAARVSASGETWEEAVAMLADLILATYERLEAKAAHELGPLPQRQKRVLARHVEPID